LLHWFVLVYVSKKPIDFHMKIFVVESDKNFRDLIESQILENSVHEVQTFLDAQSFLKHQSDNPDILILNISLPDMSSEKVINKIKQYNPEIQILLISEKEDPSTELKLFEKGIFGILSKDESTTPSLLNCIRNIDTIHKLHSEIHQLKSHITKKYEVSKAIVGESKAIKKVLALVEKAIIVHNMPVSIHGESGTGKEMVARTIHFNSVRKEHPFITVNMGAVPKELIESELFGHEKGAFPGAYSRSVGKLEQANHGTLFINEVAELDINLQFKLFQAIQEKEITRSGAKAPVEIDTRIITATSKDLPEEVRNNNFREDLYYRLLGLPIVLPPLSERENDMVLLADHFLSVFCRDNQLLEKEFSSSARSKLMSHNYPGNVRELNAIVELAAVLSNDTVIEEEHILFSPTHTGLDFFNMDISLREFEIKIIRHFLEKYNNNVVLVAKKLEIGKSKIYNMIKNGEL